MNQKYSKKKRRKERDRPIPYQIHRYRENFVLSWLGSILLHILFFSVLFFLPMPYNNIPPGITLEIWKVKEEPPAPEEVKDSEKNKLPQKGRLADITSRYRDLQYHPQSKQKTQKAPAPSASASNRKASLPKPKVSDIAAPVKNPPAKAKPVLSKPISEERQEFLPEEEPQEAPFPENTEISDEEESTDLDNREILGEELSSILESDGGAQWLGDTLMNLQMSKRNLITPPDLNFLTREGFTSNIKVVKIQLTIAPDGTVSNAVVVFPGTGNPELDRRLRLAFLQVVFNDVRSFGRGAETGTIVLNFKG